jgi:hypothetical protein
MISSVKLKLKITRFTGQRNIKYHTKETSHLTAEISNSYFNTKNTLQSKNVTKLYYLLHVKKLAVNSTVATAVRVRWIEAQLMQGVVVRNRFWSLWNKG